MKLKIFNPMDIEINTRKELLMLRIVLSAHDAETKLTMLDKGIDDLLLMESVVKLKHEMLEGIEKALDRIERREDS
jgi:hypothetical protein